MNYYDRQRTYTIDEINRMNNVIKANQRQRLLSMITTISVMITVSYQLVNLL